MDNPKSNPSSLDVVLAHGPPSVSRRSSSSVEVLEEACRVEQAGIGAKVTDEVDYTDGDHGNSEPEGDDLCNAESSSERSDSSTSSSEGEEGDDNSDGYNGEDLGTQLVGTDDEEEVVGGPIKSKNELKVLGNRVIVEGSVDHEPLNEGSILWITETRWPLGIIDEIFGPVNIPYYVVRYNSETDIPVGISEGTAVSYVMEFAKYALDKDIFKKGYDASGENDEEISDEVEFSDDEKEAEYRRSRRLAKRGTKGRKFGNQEKNSRKKKTYCKGVGKQKRMMPTIPQDLEAKKRPCLPPSRPCNSDFSKSSSSLRTSEKNFRN